MQVADDLLRREAAFTAVRNCALLDPLAVLGVRFASGHATKLPRIGQNHLMPWRSSNSKKRDPKAFFLPAFDFDLKFHVSSLPAEL
jgi:hypothetical protein